MLVRRALLYVPASSSKMLEKSQGLEVDCVAYDLEDSVAIDKKAEARTELRKFLDGARPERVKEIAVRINAVDTKYVLEDLTEILPSANIDSIVIPKVQNAADLAFVTEVLRHLLPERHPLNGQAEKSPIHLLALIESAKGLANIGEICTASPYLSAIVFAAEDFTLDMGITRTEGLPELLFARSSIVTAAKAHDIPSVMDLVCTQFKGEGGQQALREECLSGKYLGFNGKQLIHPAQIEVAQHAFSPDEKEVEWAVRVTVADEKATKQGRGAWSLDGQMIDVPVVGRAKAIIELAEGCDMNVDEIRERWSGQEPE